MSLVYSDVIIVGGGASGLFCAFNAARRGRRVLILDSSNKLGKKILMSGGGRCNFTNLFIDPDCYLSRNPHFCKSALQRYNQWDFIGLVTEHHIDYHERKHGELFCDDSAKDILSMLLAECDAAGVRRQTSTAINSIESLQAKTQREKQEGARYRLTTDQGDYQCQSLVIATGGLSIPTMGSSGFGYDVAKQFGLALESRVAGLVPFMFSDQIKPLCESLTGNAIEVEISAAGRSFREAMLFTHRGLSGPAVLQISNYWSPGEAVNVNLLPDFDVEEYLLASKHQSPKQKLLKLLSVQLPKNLVAQFQALYWPEHKDTPIAECPDAKLKVIACLINQWRIKPSATEGYRTAEVTLGGVSTDELSSKTMESKSHQGLYFIGEVVDVTGHLGGFNFQWAWASGYAAAEYV